LLTAGAAAEPRTFAEAWGAWIYSALALLVTEGTLGAVVAQLVINQLVKPKAKHLTQY